MLSIPCPRFETGSLSFQFRAIYDCTLVSGQGRAGCIAISIDRGRIGVTLKSAERTAFIELEDAYPIDNSQWHSFALLVDSSGSRIYLDGNLEMASTWDRFTQQLDLDELVITDDSLAQVSDLQVTSALPSPALLQAQAPLPLPTVQFATNLLDPFDAAKLSDLNQGTFYFRFRTRGLGQSGTIFSLGSQADDLTNPTSPSDRDDTRPDSLREHCRITTDGERIRWDSWENGQWRSWSTPVNWLPGDWVDFVIRSFDGGTQFYADGLRLDCFPGQAVNFQHEFTIATIGQDIFGDRLFGEVSQARIYREILTEGQIRAISHRQIPESIALFDRGFHQAASYRIPSLITTPRGTLIAGADQRLMIPNDAPNEIHFVIRRSLDDGATWLPVHKVLSFPGGGRQGASVIDSCMVADHHTGRIHVMIDHFPGGIGQFNSLPGSGFDQQGRMLFIDNSSTVPAYALDSDGSVQKGSKPTDYTIDDDLTLHYQGKALHPIYHAIENNSDNRSAADSSATQLIMYPTSYLLYFWSDDDGETWSTPVHLNPACKEEWMTFLGTGPGNGIQLRNGPYAGRLLIPYYASERSGKFFSAGVVFSDDHGTSWQRGATMIERDPGSFALETLADPTLSTYESTVVELDDGRIMILARNQHPSGRVAYAYSDDGGQSWSKTAYHPDLPEIFSQPNAISYLTSQGNDASALPTHPNFCPSGAKASCVSLTTAVKTGGSAIR